MYQLAKIAPASVPYTSGATEYSTLLQHAKSLKHASRQVLTASIKRKPFLLHHIKQDHPITYRSWFNS
jgi:hypothetical protein